MTRQIAFLSLGIASGVATALASKFTKDINKFGKPIGVSASKGKEFLALTWVATALMLLGSLLWIGECCAGRRKSRSDTYTDKNRY